MIYTRYYSLLYDILFTLVVHELVTAMWRQPVPVIAWSVAELELLSVHINILLLAAARLTLKGKGLICFFEFYCEHHVGRTRRTAA